MPSTLGMKGGPMIKGCFLLIGVVLMMSPGVASSEPLSVVDTVDIQRYMGRWYAIASIPTTFERQCAQGTTADYSRIF